MDANLITVLAGVLGSVSGASAIAIFLIPVTFYVIERLCKPEGLTRDDILDNATLYWLTNTTISSARLYWESKLAFFAPKHIDIPVAVTAFPNELYQAPRS